MHDVLSAEHMSLICKEIIVHVFEVSPLLMVLVQADYMNVCSIFVVSQEELYYILCNL